MQAGLQVAGGVQMGHAAGGNGLRIGGRGLGTSDEPGGFPGDSVDFVQGVGRQLLDESVLGIRGHQQLLVAGGAVRRLHHLDQHGCQYRGGVGPCQM